MAGYTPDLAGERMTKTRYVDDSYKIEYVYDLPDDEAAPYLTCSLTFESTEADARGTYTSIWGGTKVAFMMLGDTEVSVDERSELFHWGDFSRFGVLTTDGIPFGTFFSGGGEAWSFTSFSPASISTKPNPYRSF